MARAPRDPPSRRSTGSAKEAGLDGNIIKATKLEQIAAK